MLWVKVCMEINTRTTCSSKISNTVVKPCYCALQGEGSSIPTGGSWKSGNQLPLSRGSGLAGGEWQQAGQRNQQAVIIWFTHNQPLIVSHWAAGTCHLELSGNSQGFWRAELASCPSGNEGEASVFNAAGPCSRSLLGAHSQGGFGVGLLLCSDSLIDSWLERLRVASHSTTESNPKAGVFISSVSWKIFFFFFSSLDFFFSFPSQSGQLHVAKKVFSLNNSNFTAESWF